MKKHPLLRLSLLLCLLLAGSCKTPLENVRYDELQKLVSIKKGPCFGRCPIYELTIYTNGIARYQGERFTDKLGGHILQLSDQQMKDLYQQLKTTNIWQFPAYYKSRLTDLPLITITQYDDGTAQSVAGKETRPFEVKDLEGHLDKIANYPGWKLRQPLDLGVPDNRHPDQMLVLLKPGVYAQRWVMKYGRQNMRIVEAIPDQSNYWLISYDLAVAFPKEMEQFLAYDPDVVQYDYNPVKDDK